MANSTLSAIRTKVRRLTRTPSPSQLSDTSIDEYINTFVLYDFPSHVKTFDLHSQVSFFTMPYVDQYSTNTVSATQPLYNFKNKYMTVFDPIYIDGRKAFYTQSRENFFNIYPQNKSVETVASGDGITLTFTGFIPNAPIAQSSIAFTSNTTALGGLSLLDVPVVDAVGNNTVIGNLYVPNNVPTVPPTVVTPTNTINYATGEFTISFPTAPSLGAPIKSRCLPYVASRPTAVLFWNDVFIIRPIPNEVHVVNLEVALRPTELISVNQSPDIEQWWQYIAYGAAKKIFEDRMDQESVKTIYPEMKVQEKLVLRRTIAQQTSQRTPSIYSQQVSLGSGSAYNNQNGI